LAGPGAPARRPDNPLEYSLIVLALVFYCLSWKLLPRKRVWFLFAAKTPAEKPPAAHRNQKLLSDPNTELELSGGAFRTLVEQVVARLADDLDSLPAQPASQLDYSPGLAGEFGHKHLPQTGTAPEQVLDFLFNQVIPPGFNATSPGFFGYLPGGGLPHAAVADLISGVVNRFVGRWAAAPSAVELEANVLRWFAEIIGYPESANGILTSGGSTANLTAFFTARQHHLAPAELMSGRYYASDQVHFSVQKAALMCGLPAESFRKVPSDASGRMDVSALAKLIQEDRAAGAKPFLVVASAGTFITGAVDEFEAISLVTQREKIWLHADAAYGGFFMLTERGKRIMRGIERCDSISLDPHKSLFLPYGTGALLVLDGHALKRAHEIDADRYGPIQDDPEKVDFCSYSAEQTRPFRGLRVWLPMALHGISPFRDNLEEKLALARLASEDLGAIPGVQIVAQPTLTVVLFRLGLPDRDENELADLNRRLVERVNAKQRVFLMNVTFKGRSSIRMCILSFRSHLDRVLEAIADVREAAADLTR